MDDVALLDALVVASRSAGSEILKLVAAGFEVERKDDQSPVTICDRAAEQIILAALAHAAPDVPTVAEMGYPGFAATAWYALMAPPGTPDEIVHKISRDVAAVLQRDDVRAPLLAQAAEPIGNSPEEATRFIESERRLWGDVARKAGLVDGGGGGKP